MIDVERYYNVIVEKRKEKQMLISVLLSCSYAASMGELTMYGDSIASGISNYGRVHPDFIATAVKALGEGCQSLDVKVFDSKEWNQETANTHKNVPVFLDGFTRAQQVLEKEQSGQITPGEQKALTLLAAYVFDNI